MMRNVYFILLLSFIACSHKGGNYTKDSSNQRNDLILQISNSNGIFLSLKDTVNMKRYQTFDECTMSGNGRAIKSPFVYVKKQNDSILVCSSDPNDSVRIYVRLNNGVWYSHMEYDIWKKKDYIPSKSELSTLARVYDRYFYNDTILELKTSYISERQYHEIFIKCMNHLYHIRNADHLNCSQINELRKHVNQLINTHDKCVTKYMIREEKEHYTYEAENNGEDFSYERKAYGLWGIQPGIEECHLYNGIDIRKYSDNLYRHQLNNTDYIYEYADEAPHFPGGTNKFYEFVNNHRNSSLLCDVNKPFRVIVEIVVEKDGLVTNAKIVKSIDSQHDNDALRIIEGMPKWSPAKLNGKSIRYKMLIPISYRKNEGM